MYSEIKQVSIIVPVYNEREYLGECLDSILNQKYKNIQVIVVDDGSTDESARICDKYMNADSRIEVVHIQNSGPVRARKEGLKLVKGDYIGFVDSDDYINPEMFSDLVKVMDETDADFVHSGYVEIENTINNIHINFEHEIYELSDICQRYTFLKKFVFDIKSRRTISYSLWSKLFKKSLVMDCYNQLDDSLMFGEDAICLINCILASKKIVFAPVAHYNYRVLPKSLSHNHNRILFLRQVQMCSEIIRICSNYKSIVDREDVYEFVLSSLLPYIKNDDGRKFNIEQYYLPEIEKIENKRVVIYGAGSVGQDLYNQFATKNIEIKGIIDEKKQGQCMYGKPIISIDDVWDIEYDYILIAVYSEDLAEEIKEHLIEKGIDREVILWERPEQYY